MFADCWLLTYATDFINWIDISDGHTFFRCGDYLIWNVLNILLSICWMQTQTLSKKKKNFIADSRYAIANPALIEMMISSVHDTTGLINEY